MTRDKRLSYCADQVRRYDPDRFLCTLFAPAARREALFALYAFNLEIAKTRESVGQPMLGMVRLQWWREAVAGLYDGEPAHHQVADALAGAVRERGLSRAAFDRLIDARERDLDDTPPATLEALEDYAAGSSAALVTLALETLGLGDDDAALQAGHHVGVVWALVGILRATAFHARRRRLFLPAELLTAQGLNADDVFTMRSDKRLAAVVEAVAEAAERHLRAARAPRADVARPAVPALLPAALADGDLARLRRTGYDVFDPRLATSGLGRRLRVVTRAAAGRY